MTDYVKSLDRLKSSAIGAATVRAFAALEADERLRNPDHLAQALLDPGSGAVPQAGAVDSFRAQLEGILPGAYHFQNSRTMYFDDLVRQALADGMRQVVILGAGFDTRAYRIGDPDGGARFFEVDAPALQAEKRAKIAHLFGQEPAHVAYLPLDFNIQSLAELLAVPGYDAALPTFFLWEGVTYYLTAAGIDATLGFVAGHAAPGSRIAFDYMPAGMIDGSGSYYGGAESRSYMGKFGEPLLFGIQEDGIAAFLEDRGFALRSAISFADLERRYLTEPNGALHGRVSGYVRIAEAGLG
jgi:methyltransferase (TIGR00027 family)